MRDVSHRLYPAPVTRMTVIPGAIRTEVVNNVATSWPIVRPVSAPAPRYSPPASLRRGLGPEISPSRPNVMMDPSDPTTWQRQYRFT